jgi:hypothetical protein
LDLTARGEVPWIVAATAQRSATGIEAAMSAGDGVLLTDQTEVDVRVGAATAATVLIVELRPADKAPWDGASSG